MNMLTKHRSALSPMQQHNTQHKASIASAWTDGKMVCALCSFESPSDFALCAVDGDDCVSKTCEIFFQTVSNFSLLVRYI